MIEFKWFLDFLRIWGIMPYVGESVSGLCCPMVGQLVGNLETSLFCEDEGSIPTKGRNYRKQPKN
jgi:hypothetical protein